MGSVFYYRSVRSAFKIMREGALRAGHIAYMNDSQEYVNGLRNIETHLRENNLEEPGCPDAIAFLDGEISLFRQERMRNSDVFCISFCKEADHLDLWVRYAKESGVCLEMDFGETGRGSAYFIHDIDKPFDAKKCEAGKHDIKLSDISYISTKKPEQEKLKRLLKKHAILNEDCTVNTDELIKNAKYLNAASVIKRKDFEIEKETRLIFTKNLLYDVTKEIKYDYETGIPKPYLEVKCMKNKRLCWPIKSIMIGPGIKQDIVFAGFAHFLNNVDDCPGSEYCLPFLSNAGFAKRAGEFLDEIIVKIHNGPDPACLEECKSKMASFFQKTDDENDYFEKRYEAAKCAIAHLKSSCNSNNICEDVEKHLSENLFTKQGVILRKSAIPYIY
ncbi:MAG: DUF2971 domain-containing protein [Clostridiales Family XIII bacterium]|jgi:hypothetical protein|nr:DUF2971 domain-containing protein [Clostridiales Family XIII bacterium]